MQPTTLPGRSYVSVGSERKSRLLFHWRARDFSIAPLTGQTPTFVRATAGGAVVDRNGVLRTPVHSQPRFEMVDLDGDGIRETAGLLIEPQRTQICPNPQAPNSWANSGSPIITTGFPDPWGGNAAILIEDDNGAGSEGKTVVTAFTGDGTKSVIFAVRAGTTSGIRVSIFDATAGTNRGQLTVTWNGSAAPTVAFLTGTGSVFPPQGVFDPAGNLWWLVPVAIDGVIAANTNQVLAFAGLAASDIGTFYLAGANAWDAALPTSWVATASSIRNADDLTDAINFTAFTAADDDVTVYARLPRPLFADTSADLGFFPSVAGIGGVAPRLRLYFEQATRNITAQIDTAGTDTTRAIAIPSGNVLEICAQYADLAVGGKVRLDVGAGFTTFSPLASAFSALGNGTLQIGFASGWLNGSLIDLKIARGPLTLAQMREAF